MKKIALSLLFLLLISSSPAFAKTIYHRTDGGTPNGADGHTCNGLTDAAWNIGNSPNCAFNHPNWSAPENGQPTTWKAVSGDIVVVHGPEAGTGVYQVGCPVGSANCIDATKNYTSTAFCAAAWTYSCGDIAVTNGTSGAFTKIVGCSATGCGGATKPQLWMAGRMNTLYNVSNTQYVEWRDLEITDHDGADTECSATTSALCGRTAFGGSGGGWHHLNYIGMDIHGLTQRGFLLGGGGASSPDVAWNITDTNIDGNKQGGIDTDLCFNAGTCGVKGIINFTRVNMRWNGCSEAYPVVWGSPTYTGRLPTNASCREGNNGGYGDMLGGSDSGGTWTFTDVNFSHNTSDAIDLLYCGRTDRVNYGNCTMTIKRGRFEGNNGQAIKGPNITLEDSLVIGNCTYWNTSPYTASGFSPCRAAGTPIVTQFRVSASVAPMYNNTIYAEGDGIIGADNSNSVACNIDFKNNIVIGAWDTTQSGDSPALFSAYTGSGQPSCLNGYTITQDYNLYYGHFKADGTYPGSIMSGAHDLVNTNPLFTGTLFLGNGSQYQGYYTGINYMAAFVPGPGSPAIGYANTAYGDNLDVNAFDRGVQWDLGGIENNSVSNQCVADSGSCVIDSECCGGFCCSNVCSSTTCGGGGGSPSTLLPYVTIMIQ